MGLAIGIKSGRRRVRDDKCRRASIRIKANANGILNTSAMCAVRSLRQAHRMTRRTRPIKDIRPPWIKGEALHIHLRAIH